MSSLVHKNIFVVLNNKIYKCERSILNKCLSFKPTNALATPGSLETVFGPRGHVDSRTRLIKPKYRGSVVGTLVSDVVIDTHKLKDPTRVETALTRYFLDATRGTFKRLRRLRYDADRLFAYRKNRSLHPGRFLRFRTGINRGPVLIAGKFRIANQRYKNTSAKRLNIAKKKRLLHKRLDRHSVKLSHITKYLSWLKTRIIANIKKQKLSELTLSVDMLRVRSQVFKPNSAVSDSIIESRVSKDAISEVSGIRLARGLKIALLKSTQKEILVTKNIFRNLFFILRRRFGSGNSYFFSRRNSGVKPIIRSLRYKTKNYIPSKKLVKRLAVRIRKKTVIVLRETKSNSSLTVNEGRLLRFKVTRGLALRFFQKLDLNPGDPVRVKRGRHDRANKKLRRSHVGRQAFLDRVLRYFKKKPLRGSVDVHFRGKIPHHVQTTLPLFLNRIVANSYRHKNVWIQRVVRGQRKRLILLQFFYKLLRRNLVILKQLVKTGVGLSFYRKNKVIFRIKKIFKKYIPYKRIIKLHRRTPREKRIGHQIAYAFRGIRWRFRDLLKKKPAPFLKLNRIFFTSPHNHSTPSRNKKARRV